MRKGGELILKALEKEHKRLTRAAKKAHALVEEATHSGKLRIELRRKLQEEMKKGRSPREMIKFIEKQEAEEKRLSELGENFMKYLDQETEAQLELDAFSSEYMIIKFRYNNE